MRVSAWLAVARPQRRMTKQREAAAAHRMAVLAEEFIVERIGNGAP